MVIVALFAIVILAVCIGPADWRLHALLYWVRTLYGLCSLPFAVFKFPVLCTLLTHATRTGYDRAGRTLPVYRPLPFMSAPAPVEPVRGRVVPKAAAGAAADTTAASAAHPELQGSATPARTGSPATRKVSGANNDGVAAASPSHTEEASAAASTPVAGVGSPVAVVRRLFQATGLRRRPQEGSASDSNDVDVQ